jgi:predicted  nucleic acid-binding Zn-ribbon protein
MNPGRNIAGTQHPNFRFNAPSTAVPMSHKDEEIGKLRRRLRRQQLEVQNLNRGIDRKNRELEDAWISHDEMKAKAAASEQKVHDLKSKASS